MLTDEFYHAPTMKDSGIASHIHAVLLQRIIIFWQLRGAPRLERARPGVELQVHSSTTGSVRRVGAK